MIFKNFNKIGNVETTVQSGRMRMMMFVSLQRGEKTNKSVQRFQHLELPSGIWNSRT